MYGKSRFSPTGNVLIRRLLDLADSLDDKPRHLAMAIYQLSEMGLLLAEQALDNERAIAVT